MGKHLNKILLIVGLILIGTGAVIMSGYSVSWTTKDLERPAVSQVWGDTWSVSGELKKGDWLVVTYRQNAEWIDTTKFPDWEVPVAEEVPVPHFYVSITIADPYKNETAFVEALGLQPNVDPPRLVVFPPEITKNGSLQTILAAGQGGIEGVGGIVKYDGLYNVSMTAEYRYPKYPPSYIGMWRYKVTEHHDIVFLPVGALVAGTGATSSYFGLRKKRPKVKAKGT
jgi:hypothetical protein